MTVCLCNMLYCNFKTVYIYCFSFTLHHVYSMVGKGDLVPKPLCVSRLYFSNFRDIVLSGKT